ncbi:hypothetical protein C2S51_034194 [Perilla frutescens var. frutescens]|nr:hypothetical protein C2S51_034194 [Perilla frutescens var. frutescens]
MEASKEELQIHMMKDEEEEDDGDLFEINIDIVNKIPPPQYYWENFTAATANITLLANCLLPIADVSCAVPIVMTVSDSSSSLSPPWPRITFTEDQPSSFRYKEMKV